MEAEWMSRCVDDLDNVRTRLITLYSEYMFEKEHMEGLTHVQTVLLRYLLGKENATISAIADYMGVTMAAVSSLVDRLVKSALLNRERSESDRRVVYISLTPKGKESIEKYLLSMKKRMEELLFRMGRENTELYLKGQKSLLAALEQAVKEKNM